MHVDPLHVPATKGLPQVTKGSFWRSPRGLRWGIALGVASAGLLLRVAFPPKRTLR